jgi:hypothetical protein
VSSASARRGFAFVIAFVFACMLAFVTCLPVLVFSRSGTNTSEQTGKNDGLDFFGVRRDGADREHIDDVHVHTLN